MNEKEYLNMVFSRFEEASQFHSLLNTINLRFHNNPAAPILIQLVENMRDEALELGIQEYGIFKKHKCSAEGGAVSRDTATNGE